MLPSEKLAIAAHLHVLLRRKTGRVTDTEWMAANAEYAAEIVRFARARAQEDGHTDLAEWADKLAATMAMPAAKASGMGIFRGTPAPIATTKPAAAVSEAPGAFLRYVNGIR
ncbi:MAG: hypothetical protein CFE44_01770 [Burkholderiales bacterium PBB4]|nr:MAG: hypothetical protein CFE44_01770 [Burkholderiales bacterium PBB4]